MWRHAVNQRGGEVDVKDGEEEDHMDRQSNQEKGDHPHVERKFWNKTKQKQDDGENIQGKKQLRCQSIHSFNQGHI